jgi:hypothetical protein
VVHYVDVQCANIVAAVTLTGFVQILLMSLQNSKSALVTPPNVMSTTATTATAIKTSTKETLKSKFVAIYESFFKGEDPSINSNSFWDEFFLLKVNFAYLESTISSLQEDELLKLKVKCFCCLFLSPILYPLAIPFSLLFCDNEN